MNECIHGRKPDNCYDCVMANPRATIRSRDVPDEHSTATYVEGREAPRRYLPWDIAGGPNECQHGYAAGIPCPRCDATVEACARAAGRAFYGQAPIGDLVIGDGGNPVMIDGKDAIETDIRVHLESEKWKRVARAVLAAAGRGGK